MAFTKGSGFIDNILFEEYFHSTFFFDGGQQVDLLEYKKSIPKVFFRSSDFTGRPFGRFARGKAGDFSATQTAVSGLLDQERQFFTQVRTLALGILLQVLKFFNRLNDLLLGSLR